MTLIGFITIILSLFSDRYFGKSYDFGTYHFSWRNIKVSLFLIYLIKLANITELPPYGGPFAKDKLLYRKSHSELGYFLIHLQTMDATYQRRQILWKQTISASSASDLGSSN